MIENAGRTPTAFLSTPSGWRATAARSTIYAPAQHFYPRPPGGGRREILVLRKLLELFLSTPSGWRATLLRLDMRGDHRISIHALRVEGDIGDHTVF